MATSWTKKNNRFLILFGGVYCLQVWIWYLTARIVGFGKSFIVNRRKVGIRDTHAINHVWWLKWRYCKPQVW